MTAYALGTLVCFSRLFRAGYLDSYGADEMASVTQRVTPGTAAKSSAGRHYLLVQRRKIVLGLVLGRHFDGRDGMAVRRATLIRLRLARGRSWKLRNY